MRVTLKSEESLKESIQKPSNLLPETQEVTYVELNTLEEK